MSNYAISLKRTSTLLAALTFTALLLVVNLASLFGTASAAQLTGRSLTLSSSLPGTSTVGDPGSATNGSDAIHTFSFTTGQDGGSAVAIEFEYCTAALGTCATPAGLNITGATIDDLQGVDDLVVASATGGVIRLGSGDFIADNGAVTIALADIVNPNVTDAFYVRITTFSDAFTTAVDDGTVASAITTGIQITARVAETLGFSTTGDFAGVGDPGSTCTALTGSGAITLGDPDQENTLDLATAFDNYSAFRLYTNAASGVVVQYTGSTLTRTAGGNIDAIGDTPALSIPGTEQFGLAIDTVNGDDGAATAPVAPNSRENPIDFQYVNSSVGLAADGALTPAADYANGAGVINGGSHTALFAFEEDTPTTIASTSNLGNGYTECKTAAVRYLANISPTTTSGTYTTTIVYSAVPTY